MGRAKQHMRAREIARARTRDVDYNHRSVEAAWQGLWAREHTFEVPDCLPEGEEPTYIVEMLPYPSGEPHMGHLRCYAIGDALARYGRAHGALVLHPMGFDSFGLPAENRAIAQGIPPQQSTEQAIESFNEAFRTWGISIDWSRTFATHTPEYYAHTQQLFLTLWRAGLAYQREAAVKWCPHDETVLANEQARGGVCERCGTAVETRQLRQWFFSITNYAQELLDGLDDLDWPEAVKAQQRHWIGRSEGAAIVFGSEHGPFEVFTTRPETLEGVTFLALAPEYPDLERLLATLPEDIRERARAYINAVAAATPQTRGQDKRGVSLDFSVINPVTNQPIEVWLADYVLADYGTAAIMGVPAHDERDHEFAKTHDLPIVRVFDDGTNASLPYCGEGVVVSGDFVGQTTADAATSVIAQLANAGQGHAQVAYKLRDWLVSRQRYWGCPIPIVHCQDCGTVPVGEEQLPVKLPEVKDYLPRGRSPLAAATDWVHTSCPKCQGPATRETDTLDTFVDSSWYFLRYTDPANVASPFAREKADAWMPVGQYVGGIEHAILHLIYARFFCKVLADEQLVSAREPFKHLFTQGMITLGGSKMAKSRGNTISPHEFVERYGADATRCFILSLGPPEQDADWTSKESAEAGVAGMHRFLKRLHRLATASSTVAARASTNAQAQVPTPLERATQQTIIDVTRSMERKAFNTAIASVIELVNVATTALNDPAQKQAVRAAVKTSARLIEPVAPHVAAECYRLLDEGRVWKDSWPQAEPSKLVAAEFTLIVQVNHKVRARINVPANSSEAVLLDLARSAVTAHLQGKRVRDARLIRGRMVSFEVE